VDPDQLLSAILVAALVGLLGARIYFILERDPGFYVSHPGDALSLWQGGLSFYGGIFGALLGGWLYCARYGLPTLRVLDIGAIAAPLGQAIGRIGSIFNGEVPGVFTKGYGVAYTNARNPLIPTEALGRPMQPVAIYQAVFDLLLFVGLFAYARNRRLAPGRVTGLYLAAFSVGQLVITAFGVEPAVLFGLKQTQLTALPVIAAGLWLFVVGGTREVEPEGATDSAVLGGAVADPGNEAAAAASNEAATGDDAATGSGVAADDETVASNDIPEDGDAATAADRVAATAADSDPATAADDTATPRPDPTATATTGDPAANDDSAAGDGGAA
jgi:phosphatidylglycerol:prolipoprotein diacylglycerol transferase